MADDWQSEVSKNQRLPDGDWLYWLILAGRGFGKTRTVSETVRTWIKQGFNYVNLIGATADDVRTIMVEGPAGILSCCPNSERPEYLKRSYELRWKNGAISLLFSAEEPDRLRGKQHMKLACDEIAAWREPDAWDQALLGLRLGSRPQAVVATTPRPTKIIRELVANPRTHVVRGSTYDNKSNLSGAFISQIIQKYEGTRMGRQELNAEILDNVIGALWSRKLLDETRRAAAPALSRIVVAIDPSVSNGEGSNECGIVVAGLGVDNHGYILADDSAVMAPIEWARKAVQLYRYWGADRIIAEANQGGALIENTIRAVDANVAFKAVHASRGKITRAEPIAALFETGRAHLVGTFPMLEDQLCTFSAGSSDLPDRLDALVWGLTELMVEKQRPQFVFA